MFKRHLYGAQGTLGKHLRAASTKYGHNFSHTLRFKSRKHAKSGFEGGRSQSEGGRDAAWPSVVPHAVRRFWLGGVRQVSTPRAVVGATRGEGRGRRHANLATSRPS